MVPDSTFDLTLKEGINIHFFLPRRGEHSELFAGPEIIQMTHELLLGRGCSPKKNYGG